MSSYLDDSALTKVAEALGGEKAVRIIEILEESSETTDEAIANETEIRLNFVRKILYELYDNSLVSLRRTRDPETGWFVFHWKLQPDQLEAFIISQKSRVLEKLEQRLEYEKSHDFYHCFTPGCKKVPFGEAVEQVFRCPKCGESLMHYDNDKIIQVLTDKVEQLRTEISE